MDILAFNVAWFWGHWLWPVLLLVFGLGMVIFVHELGHFLVAKVVGIKVERFALGFGPRLFGYRGKETDYSIMLLPLGGYLKMLGQEDFAPLQDGQSDPRAFNNKSVGARFAVISSGVIMNVLFASLIFVLIGLVGIRFTAPVVGATQPDYPADQAEIIWQHHTEPATGVIETESPSSTGLKPGDRIVAIDGEGLLLKILGRTVTKFPHIRSLTILSDEDDKYTLTIERMVNEQKHIGKTTLGVKSMQISSGSEVRVFGITPAASLTLDRLDKYTTEDELKAGDRVIAINGRQIHHHWEIAPIEKTLLGRPTTITVMRDGNQVNLTIAPIIRNSSRVFFLKDGSIVRGQYAAGSAKDKTFMVRLADGTERLLRIKDLADPELLDVLGLIPRVRVAGVSDGSPAAKADLRPGDVIVTYGDHNAPTRMRLLELNKKFAGTGTNIVLLRDGQTLKPRRIQPKQRKDGFQIGIFSNVDLAHLVVAGVRANSPAAKAGVIPGDVVEKVNNTRVKTWSDLLPALRDCIGRKITLTVKRGTQTLTMPLGKLKNSVFNLDDYVSLLIPPPRTFVELRDKKVRRNPLAALQWGVRETASFLATTYASVRSLIRGSVSTKELVGPVGIGHMAIKTARRSLVDFVYLMAMISTIVAVVNFLPFPVVDGGHAAFL
ncbi:MAG: site-2 protease family protein, partial [Phycisphaerae bacterium]|nr:site-2 protease family protein [Phycisphaerae bacterium]